ncbi:MAG TPA: glycosyltransferase, partial [Saprospiraceae bacterium]|nr:glycosyltransferase [Saprospiraceae bacterium]
IEEILAIGDLFLIPSASESFGLSALEAMACEVPVISSNIGGLPEVNLDGITGYLCDVGDHQTMAQRAIELLGDEQKLETFRKNALQQARRFDIEHILPEYENYYQQILNNFKQ